MFASPPFETRPPRGIEGKRTPLPRRVAAAMISLTLVSAPPGAYSLGKGIDNPSPFFADQRTQAASSVSATNGGGGVTLAASSQYEGGGFLERIFGRRWEGGGGSVGGQTPPQPPEYPKPDLPPTPPSDGKKDSGGSSWIGPAVVAGVAAIGLVGAMMQAESKAPAKDTSRMPRDPVGDLLENGPRLPSQFNMSVFAIRGLVRGGWPIVVDYESRSRGAVKLQVSARGTEIMTFDLTKFGRGRHELKFLLPGRLGDRLKPGLVAIFATTPSGASTMPDFRVYGVGVGPKAVGSVGIDQLAFDPSSIRTGRSQTAGYRFYSRSDFPHVAVEFFRVTGRSDGRANEQVDSDILRGGVRGNRWVDDPDRYYWDGVDRYGRVSQGDHTLQVRAWTGSGDWVGAWSKSLLTVRR